MSVGRPASGCAYRRRLAVPALAAMVLAAGASAGPAPGDQAPDGFVTRALIARQLVRNDPRYAERRDERLGRVTPLAAQLHELQERGRSLPCSAQILNETRWLLKATDNWSAVDRNIFVLRTTLLDPDQGFALDQQPHDGSWGTCYDSWFKKLDPTVNALNHLAAVDLEPSYPLRFLEPIATADDLVAMLDRLRVNDVAATGVDQRDELGAVAAFAAELAFKRPLGDLVRRTTPEMRLDPAYAADLERFLDDWQDPETGYWGAWYRIDGKLLKADRPQLHLPRDRLPRRRCREVGPHPRHDPGDPDGRVPLRLALQGRGQHPQRLRRGADPRARVAAPGSGRAGAVARGHRRSPADGGGRDPASRRQLRAGRGLRQLVRRRPVLRRVAAGEERLLLGGAAVLDRDAAAGGAGDLLPASPIAWPAPTSARRRSGPRSAASPRAGSTARRLPRPPPSPRTRRRVRTGSARTGDPGRDRCPAVGKRPMSGPISATMTRAASGPTPGIEVSSSTAARKGASRSSTSRSTRPTAASSASTWSRCNRSRKRCCRATRPRSASLSRSGVTASCGCAKAASLPGSVSPAARASSIARPLLPSRSEPRRRRRRAARRRGRTRRRLPGPAAPRPARGPDAPRRRTRAALGRLIRAPRQGHGRGRRRLSRTGRPT